MIAEKVPCHVTRVTPRSHHPGTGVPPCDAVSSSVSSWDTGWRQVEALTWRRAGDCRREVVQELAPEHHLARVLVGT
jgi:hypothetical protein